MSPKKLDGRIAQVFLDLSLPSCHKNGQVIRVT